MKSKKEKPLDLKVNIKHKKLTHKNDGPKESVKFPFQALNNLLSPLSILHKTLPV